MPNTDSKVIAISTADKRVSDANSVLLPSKVSQHATVISIDEGLRLRPSEVVSNWSELHCKFTLSQIQIFTDLLRAVTIRLAFAEGRTEYEGVLAEIDRRLKNILSRYPGSEFDFKRQPDKNTFRECNIGKIPVTDKGFGFIDSVYDLLKGREVELQAEEQRLKRDREALVPKGTLPPGSLFEVTISHTRANKKGNYLSWAQNEIHATEKALVEFHKQFPKVKEKNYPFQIEKTIEVPRGSFSWNYYFPKRRKT